MDLLSDTTTSTAVAAWKRITKRIGEDVLRVLGITALGALLMYLSVVLPKLVDEPLLGIQLYAAGAVVIIAATTHLTRRLLSPKLDYQQIGKEAAKGNIGAGLVFLGISITFCTIMFVQAWFIVKV